MTTEQLEQQQATDATDTGEPEGDPQDWYFTFGSGHRLYVGIAGLGPKLIGQPEGIDIMGYYVKIHGHYHGARARMYALFGAAWCSQYSELPDTGIAYKLLIDIPDPEEESRL